MVPSYPATGAHWYNDEGGWEIPKVCTDTYMKSNWSETEMFKIKEWRFLYDMTEISNSWKLKSTGMWYCVAGQVLPGVRKDHIALKMWETTYPAILPNIPGDLICNNCTIRNSNLAHTRSCHVSMQNRSVRNVEAYNIAWIGKRTSIFIKDCVFLKVSFLATIIKWSSECNVLLNSCIKFVVFYLTIALSFFYVGLKGAGGSFEFRTFDLSYILKACMGNWVLCLQLLHSKVLKVMEVRKEKHIS
jgi:hypothetical protein